MSSASGEEFLEEFWVGVPEPVTTELEGGDALAFCPLGGCRPRSQNALWLAGVFVGGRLPVSDQAGGALEIANEPKMRIALVVERFQPRGGGVEGAAWQVAREIRRAGHDVHVFCRQSLVVGSDWAQEVSDEPRITIHELPVFRGWQVWRVLAFSRAVQVAVAEMEPAFDLVQSFARTRHQDVYRAGAGCHADYMRQHYGPLGGAWRQLSPRHRTLLHLEARLLSDPRQWIVCPSQQLADALTRRFPETAGRVEVIPNGVSCEVFRPNDHAESSRRLRHRHGAERARVWLFAGNGFLRKGLDTSLTALAQLRDPDLQLWVAGKDQTGSWQRRARRLGVAQQVHFLGPSDRMPELYAAADGLLLPTRYDACANVCLEAAACGKPVISSRRNGSMELLAEDAVSLNDPEDPAEICAALQGLADPAARRSLGARARKRVEGQDWRAHVEKLLRLYHRILAERERGGSA